MKKRLLRILSGVLLSCLVVPVFDAAVSAASKPVVVIVGVASPLKDISSGTLRRAFLGEAAEYASGKRLIPINQPPGTPSRDQFDQAILGLKPAETGRFWIDRRIRDQSPQPKMVPSVELVLRIVVSLPGAIAYVTSDLVTDKVRILTIDGKAPGQAGYPITQ